MADWDEPPKKQTACIVARFSADLPGEEQEAFNRILEDGRWHDSHVLQVLRREHPDMKAPSADSLRRHRKNLCMCEGD